MTAVEVAIPTVLIVSSDPGIARRISCGVWHASFETVAVTDASQALEVARSRALTLVILDRHLAVTPETELLATFHREFPDVVRIMLTDPSGVPAAVEAINKGEIFRFLVTPVSPVELVRRIQGVLGIRPPGHR